MITAEFSFTLEDYTDITERTLRRLIANRRVRAASAMIAGLFAALVAYLIASDAVDKLKFALGVFVAASVLEYTTRPMRERWRVNRLLQRQVGQGMLHCIVTLDDSGATFAQDNGTFTLPWTKVAEVNNEVDGVEFVSRTGGVSMVRARAFATPQAKAEFAAYAKARLTATH